MNDTKFFGRAQLQAGLASWAQTRMAAGDFGQALGLFRVEQIDAQLLLSDELQRELLEFWRAGQNEPTLIFLLGKK